MKLFRNPEVKRTFIIECLITGLATAVAGMLFDMRVAMYMLAVCALLICVHIVATYVRYRRISALADDINKILHGDSKISIKQYDEGEIAILQSEIYKMTIRLREQQQNLKEDKVYLADSLADISHQIRTPLTSINLLVSFLSEPGITKERQQKLSHELYELLSRIDWLITALLKISKLDAGTVKFNKEQISLEELINKSTAPLLIPIELHDQILKMNAHGEFVGDISWTCEAVTNIVKNCMEHTPEGGTITIDASENALYSEIIITDNGSGILPEDLPHIFERFYKGKNSGDKSFGIGLALARMIITSQNGTVKAENNQVGAKFIIRFYKGTV